jgi:cyclic peptide transporter
MKILKLFKAYSTSIIIFIIILGIANSALNSGMLAFINSGITGKPIPILPEYNWLLFILILAGSFMGSRLFQRQMIKMTNEIMYNFELGVIGKVRLTSLESFEKLGPERIYTAISDTRVLAQIPQVFVTFMNSAIMMICVIAYMFWLSPAGALGVIVMMVLLATFYLVRNKRIEKELNRARDMQNEYYKYLTDFLAGFKEVKMSSTRNDNLFNKYLKKVLFSAKEINVKTANQYIQNEMIGSYSWYVVMGLILFVMPQFLKFSPAQVASFMVTILFLIGPVAALIGVIPFYTRTKIAMERISRLDDEINSQLHIDILPADNKEKENDFESIQFDEVSYAYYDKEKTKLFELAPVTLRINKGEVIFVTGANGSGKSTFANLLTGLYKPESGTIYLNGNEVTDLNYTDYRDKMSVIFTNNYLFRENYDELDLSRENKTLSSFLSIFKLSSVVRFEDGNKKIDKNLSKGEQKRLAMIYLLLENKDVIILDEWAAEQDPSFRAYFYKKLIPEFKRKGKTIIAITHDDAYYHCADRIIKFDYGHVAVDGTPAEVYDSLLKYSHE